MQSSELFTTNDTYIEHILYTASKIDHTLNSRRLQGSMWAFERLPTEIWLLIFDVAGFLKRDLKRLALTCRWFRTFCIPLLYDKIVIRFEPSTVSRMEEMAASLCAGRSPAMVSDRFRDLATATHILPHVRSFELPRNAYLPPKTSFSMRPWVYDDIIRFMQSHRQQIFDRVAPALKLMPSLEHLALCGLEVSMDVSTSLHRNTRLESLELEDCDIRWPDWPRVPNLRLFSQQNHFALSMAGHLLRHTWNTLRAIHLNALSSLISGPYPPNLTSLTVYYTVPLQAPHHAKQFIAFLLQCDTLMHLDTLGRIYEREEGQHDRVECNIIPFTLPQGALPRLRRLSGLGHIIRAIAPTRPLLTELSVWCMDDCEVAQRAFEDVVSAHGEGQYPNLSHLTIGFGKLSLQLSLLEKIETSITFLTVINDWRSNDDVWVGSHPSRAIVAI